MTFSADLERFTQKLHATHAAVFDAVVDSTEQSLVFGSAITGSPGQPDDLRDKFTTERGENFAVISTNDPSAIAVETGISTKNGHPIHFHSPIGGEHSRDLTQAGFDKIVADAVRKVAK